MLEETIIASDEKEGILLRIRPELKQKLEEIGRQRDLSVTTLIKIAILEYYKL